MILQALNAYYGRLAEDPEVGIAPPGYSRENISFALVLGPRGGVVRVMDLREPDGKKPKPRALLVPEHFKRTRAIAPYILCDTTNYVLGASNPESNDSKKKLAEKFAAFKVRQEEFGRNIDDDGMKAVLAFLERWDPADAAKLEYWKDMAGTNIVFQLNGDRCFIHERPKIRKAWEQQSQQAVSGQEGFCLVTGQYGSIARLHPAIKGVLGAQTTGAALSSFNLDAFTSYGKEQNFNAPVGEKAAFAYATALNHLLRQGSRQRVQIGDATAVFWAEQPSPAEDFIAGLFEGAGEEGTPNEPAEAEDGALVQKVRAVLEAIRQGRYPPELGDPSVPFYVLGLGPNASRLVVRFWRASTVGELAANVGRHYADIQIAHGPRELEFPSLFQLLLSIAALHKAENIPPNLAADFTRAILNGGPYPMALLQAALQRNLAEQSVTYHRAALIKACLNRAMRQMNPNAKEITVSLDPEREDIGYRLGRLFAVLEKIQEEAQPDINTTIRDRFYGAASSSPVAVFGNLMKLKNHHLAKLEREGRVKYFEKLIGEVMGPVTDFPPTLPLMEQGRFAIGYYHQRQDFFTKKPATEGE